MTRICCAIVSTWCASSPLPDLLTIWSWPVWLAACAPNTITVDLTSNVPFDNSCVAEITITGLDGSSTPSNSALALISPPSGLANVGNWDSTSQTLTLSVESSGIARNTLFTIAFELINQDSVKDASDLQVIASSLFFDTDLVPDSSVPDASSGIHIPQSGDFEPFRLRGVEWEVKMMGQTTPYRKSLPPTHMK